MLFVVWCMLNFNPELTVRANLTPGKSTEAKVRAPVAGAVPGTNTDTDTDAGTVPVPTTPGITHAIPGYGLHIDDSALKRNQRSIARHINDDHYVRDFTPGEFVLTNATPVIVPAANSLWPAIEMADAVISIAATSFRKPSEWRSGRLRAEYWYTSPVGSTNNFRIEIVICAVRQTEVLFGAALMVSPVNVPGPAVANTVIRSSPIYSTTSFGNDDELFSLRLVRFGAHADDNNVNAIDILHVRLEHIPAFRESQ